MFGVTRGFQVAIGGERAARLLAEVIRGARPRGAVESLPHHVIYFRSGAPPPLTFPTLYSSASRESVWLRRRGSGAGGEARESRDGQ